MISTLELKKNLKSINGKDIHICGIGLVEYIIEYQKTMVFDIDDKIMLLSIGRDKQIKEFNIDLRNLNGWKMENDAIKLSYMNDWYIKIF
ncbi:MAG: hypothetical protein LIR50_15910 [Bacillota bacterium]|nr:hypothetical protein [Bacillota bacterium]